MDFKKIPLGTPEEFNVFIEIPAGGSNKYELDENTGFITLDFVYRNGLYFPFNYGFVPQTIAEDGDMLDAVVFSTNSIPSGTVVKVKAFGILKLKDRGEQDNKLLTVPLVDPMASNFNDLVDFNEKQKSLVYNFFKEVGVQKNKSMEIEGFFSRTDAIEEIKKYTVS